MSVSPTLLANAGSASSVVALPGGQPAAQTIASATMTRLDPSISLPAISPLAPKSERPQAFDFRHPFHRHNIVISGHEGRPRRCAVNLKISAQRLTAKTWAALAV